MLRMATLCVVLVVKNGFLLDDKNSQQSGLHSEGDNQYVTLSKYIDDKTQMNHDFTSVSFTTQRKVCRNGTANSRPLMNLVDRTLTVY